MSDAEIDEIIVTKEELEAAAKTLTRDREIEDLPSADLACMITVGQYVTDRCLAEIERRGELAFYDGQPALPYHSDHSIETVLTRAD
ncbi:MAG: hypothetical protein JWM58_548 [Rhizobium sp.]|nr:hypothetical protein [Rhizobium sp.]